MNMHLDFLILALIASTPLLLAVEGEVVVQRSGMINLGIEGMLLAAAMGAVMAMQSTNSLAAGMAGGIAGAAAMAVLFGIFAIVLRADQIVTGTAIDLLALGWTGFVYREMQQTSIFARPLQPGGSSIAVPLGWVVAPAVLGFILWRTHFGLTLRACGENPEAVTADGASVAEHRWAEL